MDQDAAVPFQSEGRHELRSGWEGTLINNNSFHFWKTYSVPDTVLRAFYAFSHHSQPPTRLVALLPFFRWRNRDIARVQHLLLVTKFRNGKTRIQTPFRLILGPGSYSPFFAAWCFIDTVTANLHMAMWTSEHKRALRCRVSSISTWANHWNQLWSRTAEAAPNNQEEGENLETGRIWPQTLRHILTCGVTISKSHRL